MTEGLPAPERSAASSARRGTSSSTTANATSVNAITLKRAFALAKEAAFLWDSRRFVARSSAVTFDALASVDDRISRLVYALSERQGLAERLLRDQEPAFNAGHAFVTAVVALRSGTVRIFGELVARLESQPELLSPLASALAWLEYQEVGAVVERLLSSPPHAVVRLGLVAAVAHRVHPGAPLARALDAEDPRLRGSALEAVGRLGARKFAPRLRPALEDEDVTCRFWGAWSAVRLGDKAGTPVLGRFAVTDGHMAESACDVGLRTLDPDQALRSQHRLALSSGRLGVVAAGIVGDPSLADWLIAQMESPFLSRAAGAAFCLMTGRDLLRDDLDGPPRHQSSETQADEDTDPNRREHTYLLTSEIDDGRAWPDAVRTREWWQKNQHMFAPGVRYLAGLPIGGRELGKVLRTGNQQQRAAAALEIALRTPDAPLLDVTAPAHRQIEIAH